MDGDKGKGDAAGLGGGASREVIQGTAEKVNLMTYVILTSQLALSCKACF